jgi:hypothetical protein
MGNKRITLTFGGEQTSGKPIRISAIGFFAPIIFICENKDTGKVMEVHTVGFVPRTPIPDEHIGMELNAEFSSEPQDGIEPDVKYEGPLN